MTMTWFRMYHGILDDPKIGMMSETDQLLWFKTLCLASADVQRGSISLSDEEIAFKLRCSLETWSHAKDKFRAKGLVEQTAPGILSICNWEKQQYKYPSDRPEATAERKQKSRAKKKAERVTTVTSESRYLSRESHATDTDTDLDPDPDPEKDFFKSAAAQQKSKPNLEQTKKSAFSESGSEPEQQHTTDEPKASSPDLGLDRELAGGGEYSAAPSQSRNDSGFVPQYQHGASRVDQSYEKPPWGWEPYDPSFLDHVVEYLCLVDPHKERYAKTGRKPSHKQAIAWIGLSRTDRGRWERVDAEFSDWQESQAAAQSRQPVIAGPLCDHRESDRPDPEAARAGVALMKKAMQAVKGASHGLSA